MFAARARRTRKRAPGDTGTLKFYPVLKRKIHFIGRSSRHGSDRDGTHDAQQAAAGRRRCATGCARSKRRRRSPPIRNASFPASSRNWRKRAATPRRSLAAGESLTYRALAERANAFARWALDQGLAKGETVCLMMSNRPEYMAIWLGLTRVGVVVSLINTNLRGARARPLHRHRGAEARHRRRGIFRRSPRRGRATRRRPENLGARRRQRR